MQQPTQGSVATLKSVAPVKCIIFTPDVEADIVEWIKDHPEFYDKKLTGYKDTATKGRLGEEKALSSTENVNSYSHGTAVCRPASAS